MPQPRKSQTARSAPAPVVPRHTVPEEDDIIPSKPLAPIGPKPTLWQRIWYGARAEKVLAARQTRTTSMAAPLDEVKAGVLAEMESMARTQGGVSGSPFATVMLPQGSVKKAAAQPATTTRTGRSETPTRGSRVPLGALLALAMVLVFGYALWQGLPPAPRMAEGAKPAGEIAQQAPHVLNHTNLTVIELAPKTTAEGGQAGKSGQAGQAATEATPAQPGIMVGSAQLNQQMVAQMPAGAMPVVNMPGVLWFNSGLMNTGPTALSNIQLSLKITDMADVPLLERAFFVAGPVLPGAALPPQRLELNPKTPERFVGQVNLAALKVHVTPLRATR